MITKPIQDKVSYANRESKNVVPEMTPCMEGYYCGKIGRYQISKIVLDLLCYYKKEGDTWINMKHCNAQMAFFNH